MIDSAHTDSFSREHLPPAEQWPDLVFTRPELQYPDRLNCAERFLERNVRAGNGGRRAIVAPGIEWTYDELLRKANQIAHVLVEDLGVVPGNRVLLRAPNTPMLAACWFAVIKAGAVAVTTMPLYKSGELRYMIEKARVRHALCDARLASELNEAVLESSNEFRIEYFGHDAPDSLERRMASKPAEFQNADTAADDVALVGFTSGTTGKPKAAMHFHRDVLAICDTYAANVLQPQPDDLFCGSPPLGFTFGLGGMLLFPLNAGAATLLLEKAPPEPLLEAIERYRCTVAFTAPVAYRAMTEMLSRYDVTSLRKCVSAGETLPLPTWQGWYDKTGIKIMDGIGSTEMLHIFIGAPEDRVRGGSTGLVVPGYVAQIHDDDGNELPRNTVGRLAVKGPTGCRYLDDDRQTSYVQRGWNYPGDAYRQDEDGYFWYVARTDDMIISAGYNISGPEVEEALLAHEHVKECAVVAKPDPARGTHIVKAYVVLVDDTADAGGKTVELIEFVKARIAAYKVPREVEFVAALPRTETGKVQRFRLREKAADTATSS